MNPEEVAPEEADASPEPTTIWLPDLENHAPYDFELDQGLPPDVAERAYDVPENDSPARLR